MKTMSMFGKIIGTMMPLRMTFPSNWCKKKASIRETLFTFKQKSAELHSIWRFFHVNFILDAELNLSKNHEKNREFLFTFKLQNANPFHFDEIFKL
mgnify:CR=1 FL=1